MTFDQATSQIIKRAKLLGLNKFVLGAITGPNEVSIRFEDISMQDAMKVFFAGIQQAVNIEIKNKPDMSAERQESFRRFLTDIVEATAEFNKEYAKTKK